MPEGLRQPALNAVKAFEAVARLGSLKAAATALGVTASAVSHQVRHLENEIGKRLFVRRNNAIELTREGHRLFEHVGPALRSIAKATEAIRQDTRIVSLNVTTSFAQLWLIPRLADFRRRHPRISIDMATVLRPIVLNDDVEMTIFYARPGPLPPVSGAVELVKDFAVPMAGPTVSDTLKSEAADIRSVPLIGSTPDDWDWRDWSAENNIDFADLNIAYRFDTDVAVIEACRAGLGVALIPTATRQTADDRSSLVPFGRFNERCYGSYWLATAPRLRRPAQTLLKWLLEIAPSLSRAEVSQAGRL